MKWLTIAAPDRIDAVYNPPIWSAERVRPGWTFVYAGHVLVIWSEVLPVEGVLRLDGVVRVGRDPAPERGGALVSVDGVLSVSGLMGVMHV